MPVEILIEPLEKVTSFALPTFFVSNVPAVDKKLTSSPAIRLSKMAPLVSTVAAVV